MLLPHLSSFPLDLLASFFCFCLFLFLLLLLLLLHVLFPGPNLEGYPLIQTHTLGLTWPCILIHRYLIPYPISISPSAFCPLPVLLVLLPFNLFNGNCSRF